MLAIGVGAVRRADQGRRHQAGQFQFPHSRRGPWVILMAAVFTGNAGVFCWWSYVSTVAAEGRRMGVFPGAPADGACRLSAWSSAVLLGGRLTDHVEACRAAAGQSVRPSATPRLVAGVLIAPGNHADHRSADVPGSPSHCSSTSVSTAAADGRRPARAAAS